MPYRRLPKTDLARIRALKAALEKGDHTGGTDLAVSFTVLSRARSFLPRFEVAHNYYTQCYDKQAKEGKKHVANQKKLRLYLSHFIQVLNMSVMRSEIKKVQKKMYDLPLDSFTVPDLTTDAALLSWGKKIIDGERERLSHGGIPIYNPAIAKVQVCYDLFEDSLDNQRGLQRLTAQSLEGVSKLRNEADTILLDIWNQVEAKFQGESDLDKRLKQCREYGVVYYYRTSEKKKMKSDETD